MFVTANETYTDAEARDKLKRVGINVNSERKTSLNGIRVSSVNALLDFKKDSKCKIVITGNFLKLFILSKYYIVVMNTGNN